MCATITHENTKRFAKLFSFIKVKKTEKSIYSICLLFRCFDYPSDPARARSTNSGLASFRFSNLNIADKASVQLGV